MSTHWGIRIKQLREEKGLSQSEVEERAHLTKTHLSRMENCHYQSLKDDNRKALARAFDMTDDEFTRYIYSIGEENKPETNLSKVVDIRCLGYVAAGIPAEAIEQDMGILKLPGHYFRGLNMNRLFALSVSGNSLSGDGIYDGDYVIVERGADIIDGKIFIVNLHNQFAARHVYRRNGHLRLVASNGDYDDIIASEVEILGRVVMRWEPPKVF